MSIKPTRPIWGSLLAVVPIVQAPDAAALTRHDPPLLSVHVPTPSPIPAPTPTPIGGAATQQVQIPINRDTKQSRPVDLALDVMQLFAELYDAIDPVPPHLIDDILAHIALSAMSADRSTSAQVTPEHAVVVRRASARWAKPRMKRVAIFSAGRHMNAAAFPLSARIVWNRTPWRRVRRTLRAAVSAVTRAYRDMDPIAGQLWMSTLVYRTPLLPIQLELLSGGTATSPEPTSGSDAGGRHG
jgi:hypothetical protein